MVVPQSTFAGPFDERVVNDLQHVLNQFIFQAHLQLKKASESELAKLKQDLVISLFRLLSVKIGVPPKEFFTIWIHPERPNQVPNLKR